MHSVRMWLSGQESGFRCCDELCKYTRMLERCLCTVQGEINLRLQAEIAGATQQADQARKSLVDWLADAVASKLSLAASTQHLHTAGGPAVATAGNRQADALADDSQVAAYLMSCNDPVKAAPMDFTRPSAFQARIFRLGLGHSSWPRVVAQQRCVPCLSLSLTEAAPWADATFVCNRMACKLLPPLPWRRDSPWWGRWRLA